MKVGLDLDGVLVDFDAGYREVLHIVARKVIPPDPPLVWDWPRDHGITAAQEQDAWHLIGQAPDFWATLPDYVTFTPKICQRLVKVATKHDVYFITDRPTRGAKQQTERWLRAHGLPESVLITPRKGLAAEALGLNVFVDDKPANCFDVRSHSPDARVYLQYRAWNRALQPTPELHITVVKSLDAVFDEEAFL